MDHRLTRRQALAGIGLTLAAPALAQSSDDLEVPFVPTPHELVRRMLDLAGVGAADYLIDLGCGDGRIAVAAAQRGARALGVDLDPMRIQEAAAAARAAGVEGRARFRRQDLFATPIYEASVVTLYLMPQINLRLRPRLMTELAPGARIVSHAFNLGDWAPDAQEQHDGRRIFLWHVPAVAGGSWELSLANGSVQLLELEQRFQEVSGTLSGAGAPVTVTGRLQGTALTLASADGAVRLAGRVGDRSIEPADASWRAERV
jgi:SAM-dependent methyltransferase